MTTSWFEDRAAALPPSAVSVEEQLRTAVEKCDVAQLRTLLHGSEDPSELAPLLRLACESAETGARRVELVELLLEKGADPSAVSDGRSALSLAVEKAPSSIVSTLLEKATPEQRVAAARTLCEKEGPSALEVRTAAGRGLEPEAKAWLEQAQRVPTCRSRRWRLALRVRVRRAEGGCRRGRRGVRPGRRGAGPVPARRLDQHHLQVAQGVRHVRPGDARRAVQGHRLLVPVRAAQRVGGGGAVARPYRQPSRGADGSRAPGAAKRCAGGGAG